MKHNILMFSSLVITLQRPYGGCVACGDLYSGKIFFTMLGGCNFSDTKQVAGSW